LDLSLRGSDYAQSTNETTKIHILDGYALAPEICVLRQVLNLLWVVVWTCFLFVHLYLVYFILTIILVSCIVYVKFRQVNDILNRYDMSNKKRLNRSSLQTGLASAFGSSIIANFQKTDLIYVYWIGIVLLFGFGAVYQCIQTVQYWNLGQIIGQKRTTILRMILSVASVASFIIFFVCMMLSINWKKHDDHLSWQTENIGSVSYYGGIVFTWVCAASGTAYLMLLQWEFTKITLYEPDVFVEDKVTLGVNMQHTNEAFES
ncbi:hypothetical protein NQ318_018298, partial [Aromia moschata]